MRLGVDFHMNRYPIDVQDRCSPGTFRFGQISECHTVEHVGEILTSTSNLYRGGWAPRNPAPGWGRGTAHALHFAFFGDIYPHGNVPDNILGSKKRIETENEPLKVLRIRIEGGANANALGLGADTHALVVGTVSGSAR